jgi:hypothetical protein
LVRFGKFATSQLVGADRFQAVADLATEEMVAESVPCGPDLDKILESIKPFVDAGFTEVAITQIGPDQNGFCKIFEAELRSKLRKL